MESQERPKVELDATFDRYVDILCDPDQADRNHVDVAQELGVSRSTLWLWRKKLDWEWVKTERRRRYASKIIDVDDAMFKAAKRGDVQAAKVLYERFDNWVPTTGTVDLSKKTDSDLFEIAEKIKREQDGKLNQQGQNFSGVSEASA